MSLFLSAFFFPGEEAEADFMFGLKTTFDQSVYPYGVLPKAGLDEIFHDYKDYDQEIHADDYDSGARYNKESMDRTVNALIAKGHSVVVVEHNLDVIRSADWVIDLGPDAGDRGGEVVFEGTPEDLAKDKKSVTARYLRE